MKDPIIQELWKIKDRIAKECGYDVNKLVRRLQQKEKSSKPIKD